jgi:hypothetical protein
MFALWGVRKVKMAKCRTIKTKGNKHGWTEYKRIREKIQPEI